MEYVHKQNPNAVMRAFGQELNPESYAICKADMLIKARTSALLNSATPFPTINSPQKNSITCFLIHLSAWTGKR
ncbi:hypothetical protein O5466_14530 [Escherichia coli]|nr:hypothetical protein [Escherichia coli]